ncbi:hypothetical protein DFH29DRAFT_800526 [Suillus ampliporus]|nr:hypothetical protein DFH29DRAFT_800526 [Suillus ampliporus]
MHTGRFLIDSFPRKFDQTVQEKPAPFTTPLLIGMACFIGHLQYPRLQRLLERPKTSGRDDEIIGKRLR